MKWCSTPINVNKCKWRIKHESPTKQFGTRAHQTSFDADILVTSQNGTKLVKICNWTWTTRTTKLIYHITILISAWFVFKESDMTCMWCIWRCIIYVHWSVRWTTFITFLRTICLLCWNVRIASRWYVMNAKRTGLWLRQKDLICGHLWHRYAVTVNQVIMVATVKLSKWWLQLNHKESLVR